METAQREMMRKFVQEGLSPELAALAAESADPEATARLLRDQLAKAQQQSGGYDEGEFNRLLTQADEALSRGDSVGSVRYKNMAYRLRNQKK